MENGIKLFVIDVDGTLTDGTSAIAETGVVCKSFCSKDFYALEVLVRNSYKVLLIADTSDRVIYAKAGKNYKIINNSKNKFDDIANYLLEEGITWEEVAYIGDSESDIKCMTAAKFSGCPHDAVPEIIEHANYSAHAPSGKGAVYETIRYFFAVNKLEWN